MLPCMTHTPYKPPGYYLYRDKIKFFIKDGTVMITAVTAAGCRFRPTIDGSVPP